MKLEVSSFCDVGLVRKRNQDAIMVYRNDPAQMGAFLVSDGMGGYADGERASTAIANGIRDWLEAMPDPGLETTAASLLMEARQKLTEINSHIWQEWNQGQVCGATCVLLLIVKEDFGIISVGDSRVYRRSGWRFEVLTKDDIWENQSEIRSRFSKEELVRHPNYGRLTQAMGNGKDLFCSTQSGKISPNDVFLLCSDGIYKMCPPQFLKQAVRPSRKKSLDQIRDEIKEAVWRGGARDNASLILVRCGNY